jgi:hypothetical protein
VTAPTESDLKAAVGALAAMKFFPSDAGARASIQEVLRSIADDRERLRWLVNALINTVPEWPGPLEVRALYCTRWTPADGLEACSGLPGYTMEDLESQHIQIYKTHKTAKQISAEERRSDPDRMLPAAQVLKGLLP